MDISKLWPAASLGVLAGLLGGGSASAQTISSPQTAQVVLTNPGDSLTITSSGAINYSSGGTPPFAVIAAPSTGGVSIVNNGVINDTFATTNGTAAQGRAAIRSAALSGTTLTVNNSGVISGSYVLAFSANNAAGRTGSTNFTNSGTISGFTSGYFVTIPIGGGGTYNDAAAMLFGLGDDTLTNSGTINGDVFMGAGNDTVNILTGSHVNGTIHGDDGTLSYNALDIDPTFAQVDAEGGTINFIGSINTKTSQQEIGSLTGPDYAVYMFRNVHFQSGYWTLSADVMGRVFTIDSGATVELHDSDARFNEFVVWHDPSESLVNLVNNGHMIFYNDLTTLSTDDGLNYNISGTGSLDLYNTAGSNTGMFQFGATGGFGGGLNLHGGTVILVSDYTGNINVFDGGTLRIGGNLIDDPNPLADPSNLILGTGGGTTGNVIGNLNIDGTLIFDRSNDITFAGNLSGSGLIIKNGTGTTTLSGTFNYTGDMQILGGFVNLTGNVVNTGTTSIGNSLLRVNGSISSDVNVGSGGTLGGSGAVNGDVTVGSGGTVGPGNSPGTLNVNGNFGFSSGSTYQIQTLPNGAGDKIVVAGGALTILPGATAAIDAGGTTYSLHTNYTIATATGGIVGTFSTVTSNLAFLDPTLTYSANAITLTLTRNDVAFTDLATTPNQAGVAGAIEQLNGADPVFLAALNLDASSAPDAYNQLSGDVHASLQSTGLTSSLTFLGQVGDRLMALSEGPQRVQLASLSDEIGSDGQPSNFWLEAFGSHGSLDGGGGTADLDSDRSGISAGFDSAPSPNSRIGVALGYANADLSSNDRDASANVDSYEGALYGGANVGSFVLRGALGYSRRSIDARRTAVVGMLTEHLRANYDAQAAMIEGEIARPFVGAGGNLVEPYFGLTHIALDTDGFTETGGSSALTVADASSEVTLASLGLRGRRAIGAGSSLFGSLAWRHASGDISPESDMAFASNPGSGFTVAGAPIAEDAAEVEAGIRLALGGFDLTASYRGEFASDASDNGARLRANWSF